MKKLKHFSLYFWLSLSPFAFYLSFVLFVLLGSFFVEEQFTIGMKAATIIIAIIITYYYYYHWHYWHYCYVGIFVSLVPISSRINSCDVTDNSWQSEDISVATRVLKDGCAPRTQGRLFLLLFVDFASLRARADTKPAVVGEGEGTCSTHRAVFPVRTVVHSYNRQRSQEVDERTRERSTLQYCDAQ